MPNERHNNAERFAAEAELALRSGAHERATRLYGRAAAEELAALASVPAEKGRTRGILAVSAASLLYKGRRWSEAERVIFQFLGTESLPPKFQRDLRDLLEVVWDERVLAEEQHARYASDGFVIAMRGGLVGVGTAPLDQFLHTFDGIRSLFYRITEWAAGLPFRKQGLPREEIRDLLRARTTQPAAGSYRFRIRLVEPEQLELFGEPLVRPRAVADSLFEFVERVSAGDENQLAKTIPDEQYRAAMLKLLRNILPDGHRLGELQLFRDGAAAGESISIFPETKRHIRTSLQRLSPPPSAEESLIGTLRALDLDKKSIDVSRAGTEERDRCYASDIILDDVVGPMVNHRVKVTGIRTSARRRTFHDIELDEGETA